MPEKSLPIGKRINNLIEALPDFERDKEVSMGGRAAYDYISVENLRKTIKALMPQHGIVVRCHADQVSEHHDDRTHFVTLQVAYHFFCDDIALDAQEPLRVCVIAQGADTGDKAAYKAMTGSWKYAVGFLTLMAGSGDEPENGIVKQSSSTGSASKVAKKPTPRPAPKPAPKAAPSSDRLVGSLDSCEEVEGARGTYWRLEITPQTEDGQAVDADRMTVFDAAPEIDVPGDDRSPFVGPGLNELAGMDVYYDYKENAKGYKNYVKGSLELFLGSTDFEENIAAEEEAQ
jgi:hypothetical protein